MDFYALGTEDMYAHGGTNTSSTDPRNWGRGMFTGKDEDMFKFKVPQLYNLADYTHFFHGSSKTTLEDVIDFKVRARSENKSVEQSRISSSFRPLFLDEEQKANLVDFLRNALHDEDVQRFVPESVLSGYCFPNNDKMSREEMGCD